MADAIDITAAPDLSASWPKGFRKRVAQFAERTTTTSTHPRHRWIEFWDDERDIGNGLIVTLASGWAFFACEDESAAEHVRGFDTVKEAMAAVRAASLCPCGKCRAEKSTAA